MLRKSCFTAIVSFCLVFAMAIPAMAQENEPQEVTDEELNKAAEAYVQIATINQNFQEAVQQTSGQDERQALQQETQDKMIKAVEKAELDVESYNRIMHTIDQDPETADKFRSKIKDLQ